MASGPKTSTATTTMSTAALPQNTRQNSGVDASCFRMFQDSHAPPELIAIARVLDQRCVAAVPERHHASRNCDRYRPASFAGGYQSGAVAMAPSPSPPATACCR